jgi:hypothetical protein
MPERFTDGKHLEQEWEFASKSFTDIRREQGLVILNRSSSMPGTQRTIPVSGTWDNNRLMTSGKDG